MIQEKVFFCGESVLPHPVVHFFRPEVGIDSGEPTASALKGKRLVVADCRTASLEQLEDWTQAVPRNIPFLLLCPAVDHLRTVRKHVGCLPTGANAATLIRGYENSCGLMNHLIDVLSYSAPFSKTERRSALTEAAKARGIVPEDPSDDGCGCTDFEELLTVMISPRSANDYFGSVEAAMEQLDLPQTSPSGTTPPTGVKYIVNTITNSAGVNYSTNSDGNLSVSYELWGFLSQGKSGTSQYLAIKLNSSLSAGKLIWNDHCDRGYATAEFRPTIQPTQTFGFVDSAPTSGSNTFSGSVDFTVSYIDPESDPGDPSYLSWQFSDSVSSSATDWECSDSTGGNLIATTFFMTTPCNGSDLSNDWEHAFTGGGHVKGLTSASTGTLQTATYGVWNSTSIMDSVSSVFYAVCTGVRFWGSSKSPGLYWKRNEEDLGKTVLFHVDADLPMPPSG